MGRGQGLPKGQWGPGSDAFKSNKSKIYKSFVDLRPKDIQLKGAALRKYL